VLLEEKNALIATSIKGPAAAAKPACLSTNTNGLSLGSMLFQGHNIMTIAKEPTYKKRIRTYH